MRALAKQIVGEPRDEGGVNEAEGRFLKKRGRHSVSVRVRGRLGTVMWHQHLVAIGAVAVAMGLVAPGRSTHASWPPEPLAGQAATRGQSSHRRIAYPCTPVCTCKQQQQLTSGDAPVREEWRKMLAAKAAAAVLIATATRNQT